MHRLEVHAQEILRAALIDEARHSRQSRFAHRLHCVRLVGAGRSCYEVAEVFGDNPRTVERWVREFEHFGIDGLKERPRPGRHAKLAKDQMQGLALALGRPPRELGYAVGEWDGNALRAEILRRFGVTLSRRHCQRLIGTLRQSSLP